MCVFLFKNITENVRSRLRISLGLNRRFLMFLTCLGIDLTMNLIVERNVGGN